VYREGYYQETTCGQNWGQSWRLKKESFGAKEGVPVGGFLKFRALTGGTVIHPRKGGGDNKASNFGKIEKQETLERGQERAKFVLLKPKDCNQRDYF